MSNFQSPEGEFPNGNVFLGLLDHNDDRPAYERLESTIFDRIGRLEQYDATPNRTVMNGIDIPFGQYGEDLLCGTLILDEDGELKGSLNSRSPSGQFPIPRVVRHPDTHEWRRQGDDKAFNDAWLLRKLDRHWPSNRIDNTRIRNTAGEDGDTVSEKDRSRDISEIFCEELIPHARQVIQTNEYSYYDVWIDDDNGRVRQSDIVELRVDRVRLEGYDAPTMRVQLERSEHTFINGLDTLIRCLVEIDEDSGIEVSVSYKDSESGKSIEVPVSDDEALVEDLIRSLDNLTAEKIGMSPVPNN